MADSNPSAFFRPGWHDPYWRRPRYFQQNAVVVSAYTPYKRRHTLDRFRSAEDPRRPRRFSPLGILYTGSISLLWGV